MAYESFKQRESEGMSPALLAFLARRKYGEKAVAHASATGTSLKNVKPLKKGRLRRRAA